MGSSTPGAGPFSFIYISGNIMISLKLVTDIAKYIAVFMQENSNAPIGDTAKKTEGTPFNSKSNSTESFVLVV